MNLPTPRPAERADLLAPVLLCAAVVVAFYGGLLVPGRGLAARDIPFLHLPLRTALRALLASGATPTWDPWEHGGQPLLSNPHYAAFYPFTWLLLWLPPLAAIHATVVLHGTLAFAGAWRLARRWELGRIAAAVAAVGYSANGAFASLPGTLLMFCGFAWLPWAWSLAGPLLARPLADRPSGDGALSPLVLLAGVLALQMLNGDPAAVLVTWLGLGAMALVPPDGAAPLGARLRRLSGALALGVLLASVQAMPTWARLQDSARGAGLGEESTVWSTRPLRLLEALNPRLFGDPTRDEEDLYFGAPLNDKNFPFLQSIYSGCLLTSLGIATLLVAFRRRPEHAAVPAGDGPETTALHGVVPLRALALAAALGILLGLGRFDPLWPALRTALPFLDLLRYPEKFLLLTLAAVVFAGAAGLDRLLNAPANMTRVLRRVTLGVAAGLVAFDAIALAVSWGAGPAVRGWIGRAALAPLPADALTAAAQFLRREMVFALVCAGLSLALLCVLARPRRRRVLGIAAVALLFLDLAYYGRRALPTVPAEDLTTPRAPARGILVSSAADQRLFSDALFAPHESTGGFRIGTPGTRQIETLLDALTPSSAATTGLAYALHRDFDLMLTGWGRQAVAQAQALGPASPRLPGLLAAWNVGTLLRARSPEEQVREFRQTHVRPLPVEAVPVAPTLPRWRFAASAECAPDAARAFERAAAGGFDLAHREILVAAPAGADSLPELDPGATVLSVADRGGSVTVRYRARGAALFVAAQTFDDGWSARVGDAALPTWPTALGQLAVLVPAADEGTLSLRYSDPWLKVGGATSAVTVLALLLAASRRRRGTVDPIVPPPAVA